MIRKTLLTLLVGAIALGPATAEELKVDEVIALDPAAAEELKVEVIALDPAAMRAMIESFYKTKQLEDIKKLATDESVTPEFKLEYKILVSEGLLIPEAASNATGVIGDDKAFRKLAQAWKENKEVSILSMSSVWAAPNQEAVMRMLSEIQYFERTKDGTFILKSLPEVEAAGVRLSTTTSNSADKGKVSIDVDLRINTLSDRKEIPGVTLDIGQPVMETEKINTQAVIPVGQWVWIGSRKLQDLESGKAKYLLCLLKVTSVDGE